MHKDFHRGFEKRAALSLREIENVLGRKSGEHDEFYVTDPDVRKRLEALIASQNNSSFALRHPVLTGIPTLGIWPANAKDKAITSVIDHVMRGEPGLRKQIEDTRTKRDAERKKEEEEEHRKELELMPLRQQQSKEKAQKAIFTVGTGAALSGLDSYLQHQRAKRERESGGSF